MDADLRAVETLTRFSDALETRDWEGLAALLAPGFNAHLLHTGETFDRDGFVAFNRDYPGDWSLTREDVVAAGSRGVLRSRVRDDRATYHAASFATLDHDGRILDLVEVWTDAVTGAAGDAGAEPHLHHGVDYLELGVTDLGAAQAFYAAALGWAFVPYGPTYAGIRAVSGRGERGGLNAAASPSPGGPLVLLWSDDLDATLDAVVAAGGAVIEGPEDFPGGRRFRFADPDGNELGVWTST
ncbi:VOC family protein [Nocardioides dongkuii]|uniref:VOC family protein n=1 Tax=Nocardioides dongkuii TaxID=2760089 RepID=UPI0015F878DA|nr:VOC family protein [Nocardioides dongkuii]